MRSRTKTRVAKVAALSGVAATALVGLLHLPAARPLLARLGVKCPMGEATVESVDAQRRFAAAAERGADPAPARPALSFSLDVTTRDDVRAWTAKASLDCSENRPALVRCHNVPAALLGEEGAPTLDELDLGFDPRGHLVNVSTFRRNLDPASASRAAEVAASALRARLGVPAEHEGAFDRDTLARGTLASGSVGYHYRDYVAGVTAVNLGDANVAVREQYMSAND